MSLKLASNNAPAYLYYSSGDGSSPVSVSGTITGTGGTVDSTVVTMYLIATTFRYTGITLSLVNEQAGMDWKLSLDNITFADTRAPADMNALVTDQVITVYAKCVLANDGSGNQPVTGIYTVPDIRITATEQPV
jgi:hypothetical protein